MKRYSMDAQRGLSLTGLIFLLAVLGFFALLGMKIVPTVSEYLTIKKAIVKAQQSETSVKNIQASFDNQLSAGYAEAIAGKDLEIVRNGDGYDVSFAYQKKIPLVGPVSLVIDYEGTTAKTPGRKQY